MQRSSPPLRGGVNVPIATVFDAQENLDIDTTVRHCLRLARAGVSSITVHGSNGEAVHLTHEERVHLVRGVRGAMDQAGFSDIPIVVGCSAQSVRESVMLCQAAFEAGGNCGLLLPPSYFQSTYPGDTLLAYFTAIADSAPFPIMIYNYPGAVAGTDLNSDELILLSKHPNIVGCKLICGNTGKLCRVAAATNSATAWDERSGWVCMGGSADFMTQTLIVNGSGTVTGLGNIAPKTCVKLFDLCAEGKFAEAWQLQVLVARGDWAVISGGIPGTKYALQQFFSYGGGARKPLPTLTHGTGERFVEMLKPLIDFERTLNDKKSSIDGSKAVLSER